MLRTLLLALVPLLFCGLLGRGAAASRAPVAQEDGQDKGGSRGEVSFELKSDQESRLAQLDGRVVIVHAGREARIGILRLEERRRVLRFAGDDVVVLPRDLEAEVSLDGKRIVQFGDEVDKKHPTRTDLHWLDATGEVVASERNTYGANASVSVSDGGAVAVAGTLLGREQARALSLHGPDGALLWRVDVSPERRVGALRVAPGAGAVAVLTTDPKAWREDHRIVIHGAKGEERASLGDLNSVQKLVFVSDERLFVQSFDSFALLDVTSGRQLWRQDETLRMASPHGAASSPDGRLLFLAAVDWSGRSQERYGWRLLALDAGSGARVGSTDLPGRHAATWSRVFAAVDGERIVALAGENLFELAWSVKN